MWPSSLLRYCQEEELSCFYINLEDRISGVRTGGGGGGFGGQTPPLPIDDWKKLKTALFGPIRLFFTQRLCFSVLYQIANIILRNFHRNAIIPVVKLFWCVALEPISGSKCKSGQGQWTPKLESCCDVIKTLFSTAMAGQDNVSAQKAFLEESGCNAGRYIPLAMS